MNDTNLFECDGIPVHRILNGVQIVNMTQWLHLKMPDYYTSYDADMYEKSGKLLKEWCEKNNGYYYAAEKEDFSLAQATREAAECGCKVVVVDNLS